MALFNKSQSQPSNKADGKSGPGQTTKRTGLASLIETTVQLSAKQVASLRKGLEEGEAFYDKYNNSRLKLAFSSFDKEMRLAVYELLFLMHVNHPKLANWAYGKKEWVVLKGIRRQLPVKATADLYLEGAPAGVQMIGSLPDLFRSEYESYIKGVFDMPPYGEEQPALHPIVTVQSVGSIGTIGHKSKDSDLDLQIVYDLVPFVRDTREWNDDVFKAALNHEHKWWSNQLRRQQKITPEQLKDPEVKKKLTSKAAERIIRTYPGLYKYLVQGDQEFATMLLRPGADKTLKIQVLHEILNLMKRAEKLSWAGELRQKEALLKKRLNNIQEYINNKFPEAEIYLFVYTTEWFRQGSYSSTLEFKESSGSAYEMILNYETLMPGIQFTPLVPTHFIMPVEVNNDPVLFSRLIDYMRFQVIDLYAGSIHRFVDLGHTPNLKQKYVAEHGGAIYWEAFKASSGNLPKAWLNLLRFEMLLDEHLAMTIIQIVKDPKGINHIASQKIPGELHQAVEKPQKKDAMSILRGGKDKPSPATPTVAEALNKPRNEAQQMQAMANLQSGLPPWAVLEIEQKFPTLLQDSWWLRFKALKVGFCEEKGVSGIEQVERDRISKAIDLAFCLHVRISDVMKPQKAGKKEQQPPSFREEVLLEFLDRAFPPSTPRRINLETLFAGGVRGLILFENELRDLFQRSMSRVEQKMSRIGVFKHTGDKQEVELWLNFYLEHFHPVPESVPRVIMKHLKIARNGIEVSYRPGDGWAFLAFQRQTLLERSKESGGSISYLPEKVLLLEKSGFASGMAHCILNGYYGIVDRDTPNERTTEIELNDKKLDQGNNIHNDLAALKTEQVNTLMKRLAAAFSYQPYDYMEILNKDRIVTAVFVMVNLWRFGQVSIIHRDNISTWYCHEFEVPGLLKNALDLTRDYEKLTRYKPLLAVLSDFFRKTGIDSQTAALHGWFNPNSLTPDRTQTFYDRLKDMEEGTSFSELMRRFPRAPSGDTLAAS